MVGTVPNGGLQIQSTVKADGTLEIRLADAPVTPPGEGQVLVRVEAAPINPSDMIPMLAGANPAAAHYSGKPDRPVVTAHLPMEAVRAMAGRIGHPLAVGLEGAGEVVAAGAGAEALVGRRVAFLTLGMGSLGQYCTMAANECMPLPDDVSFEDGADLFCNPMTVLAMVETLYQTGHKAMIHTAAASNVGRMLVKVCQEDGVGLVNVVRRKEQADLLRAMGAEHVCNSSDESFSDDLAKAVEATGATVAFDAIGGGEMASQLLQAMERAAVARMPHFAHYGTPERKVVYIYGLLNPGATVLPRHGYGMVWTVEGWAMPPIMERAGPQRAIELTQRIVAGLKTTFASEYGHRVSLAGALTHEAMTGFYAHTTGGKYLVKPWA